MRFPYVFLAASAGISAVAMLADSAKPVRFNSFKSPKEVTIPLPASVDSVSAGINKFETSQLLNAKNFFHKYETQNWTTVLADTGRVAFPKAQEATLRTFVTHLRPERYAKGKIRIKSTSMADVLVNGNSMVKKTTSDSVPTLQEGALEMLPETDYAIQVNLLALPSDKSAPEFQLEFVPDNDFENVPLTVGNETVRHFQLEDISLGKRVSYTSISPDGKYIIVGYADMFDAKNTRRWAEIRETATGKVIQTNLRSDISWMPKGSRYYYAEQVDGLSDIYAVALPAMTTKLIARGLPDSNPIWSPNEDCFLYYKSVEGKKEEGIMKRYNSPDDRIVGNRDKYYLMKYDLASGVSTPVTYGGPSTIIGGISPDGKKLLYLSTRETPSQYPFYLTSIIQTDLTTLKADTLVKDDGAVRGAIYSPNGKQLFVTGGPTAFDSIGVNAGNHPIPNDFDTQGYIFDIATRKAKAMTRDFDPALDGTPLWNSADNKIYFRAEDGFNRPLYCLDPATGKISKLTIKVDNDNSFSMGDFESRWLAYVGQSFNYNGQAWLLDLKTGKNTLIDDPLADRYSDINFGKMSEWSFTAADGTMVDGRMCLPPDFDPAKKYPLIVYYYGGTSPSTASIYHPYAPQVFASKDYVVYVLNPSGTTGYGQEYSSRHVNAWGDYTADEIIEGVKKFCKDHPFVDDKKVGCIGASYGGFMTQLLQTKTDIFAAAVSHAGISNVTSYWGEGYWGYSYNAVAAAQSYPWTNPELFTKHGSLFNADKIHTPLLLLHGTADTNVPIGESIQLFNALKVLGRNVEFITVEGENHVITDYEKRILWHNTIMAWFAKWLQNDSRWWDSMYGK